MFISDEEANARVSSLDNLINKLELRKINNGGRPRGRKNDTQEKRLEIATTAIVHGPTAAAEKHKTTISRSSLLSNGIITHSDGADEQLADKVQDKKEKIHDKALNIVTKALLSLDGKIDEVQDPTKLAQLASEMAKIAERTGGRLNREETAPKSTVIIYAPRMKDENEFEVIDVN